MRIIRALALAATASWVVPTLASPLTLTFEGVGNSSIGNFYSNDGVSFSSNAYGYTAQVNPTTGETNFSGEPSANTVMISNSTDPIVVNLMDGFTGYFSYYYSSQNTGLGAVLWSGQNGTGTIVGGSTGSLGGNSNEGGCTDAVYCSFSQETINFSGTAESVVFNNGSAAAQAVLFDNLTFGNVGAPVNPVPEPGSLALVGLALAGIGLQRRRSKA